MKKVSIIIPVYNAEKTLKKSLDSVLAQTYKNLEIIIINDGSKDSSLEIIKSYQAKDPRIVLLDQPNSGVSTARNNGLAKCTGDYVKFHDADDSIPPEAVEKMVKKLEETNSDMVVCGYDHVCLKSFLEERVYNFQNLKDLRRFCEDMPACATPWNKLFRREVLTEKFDKDVKFAEDDLYNLSIFKNLKNVYFIKEHLYDYYVAPPDPNGELSAVMKVVSGEFWKSDNTQWFQINKLIPKRKEIANRYPEEVRDILIYNRVFDYFFWEELFFLFLVDDAEKIAIQVDRIFKEEEFLKALKIKEQFGVKFVPNNNFENIYKFVKNAKILMGEIMSGKLPAEPYFVLMMLFCKYFCKQIGELKTEDVLARTMAELIENETPLAKRLN